VVWFLSIIFGKEKQSTESIFWTYFKWRNKFPAFGEKVIFVSSRQSTSSHIRYLNGKNGNDLKFELLTHDPYSPELALSDCFPNLMKCLGGKRFANYEAWSLYLKATLMSSPILTLNPHGIQAIEDNGEGC
jgi:hypothetical protein